MAIGRERVRREDRIWVARRLAHAALGRIDHAFPDVEELGLFAVAKSTRVTSEHDEIGARVTRLRLRQRRTNGAHTRNQSALAHAERVIWQGVFGAVGRNIRGASGNKHGDEGEYVTVFHGPTMALITVECQQG